MEDIEHVIIRDLQYVHVSFKYTSACKIITINDLKISKTSDMIRARGQFYNGRYWRIDMKRARQLYLSSY